LIRHPHIGGVRDSAELTRILSLPHRVWEEDPDLEAVCEAMTDWLKTPQGNMALRPVQAKALEELHDFGGVVTPVKVGQGKTLLSYLAPVVVGAKRPLLLVPGKLRGKTYRDFKALAKHWIGHPKMIIHSYQEISRDAGWDRLTSVNPDLIVADESHHLKNRKAGCTRKVHRWFKENPGTKYVDMSGTMASRSSNECAHRLSWALRTLSPLPLRGDVLAEWAAALDEKVDPIYRIPPGALLKLCTDDELGLVAADPDGAIHVVRRAYRRRFMATPGVVVQGKDEDLGCSLIVSEGRVSLPDSLDEHFRRLRECWETPDGHPFTESADLWRHARELVAGFYYVWDPRPPESWLGPRREWCAFVRSILGSNRKGIDTEMQVKSACIDGRLPDDALQAWLAVKDTFKPNSVPRWVHDATIEFAAKWLEREKGLVWTEHRAFGQRLAEVTGMPYFAQGGMCGDTYIEDHRGPAILSVGSNSEGRNLQHGWSKSLVISAAPKGSLWEQLLGRTHRSGQGADEVSYEVLIGCRELYAGMMQVLADARYTHDTQGMEQKILTADVTLPSADEVANRTGPLWA